MEIYDGKKGRRRKKEEEKPTIEKSYNVKNRNLIKVQREKKFFMRHKYFKIFKMINIFENDNCSNLS